MTDARETLPVPPPTLLEIRTALRSFATERAAIRDLFVGRLETTTSGTDWAWGSLRRKIREGLEAMERGDWAPELEIRIPANSIAEAVQATIPPDVMEAIALHEALRKAIGFAGLVAYAAANLPGQKPAEALLARVEGHGLALEELKDRMEEEAREERNDARGFPT